jgi:hypothetical protein
MTNQPQPLKVGDFVTTPDGQFVVVMYLKQHGDVLFVGLSNGTVKPASTLKKS